VLMVGGLRCQVWAGLPRILRSMPLHPTYPFAGRVLKGRFGAILRIRRSPAYRPVSADSGPFAEPR
jgi:hypothetical protein